jgi:hypothetical protein
MTKYKSIRDAVIAINRGKLQVSCRSKIEADKVCVLVPDAVNDYEPKNDYKYLGLETDGKQVAFCMHLLVPVMTAKRFLTLGWTRLK